MGKNFGYYLLMMHLVSSLVIFEEEVGNCRKSNSFDQTSEG